MIDVEATLDIICTKHTGPVQRSDLVSSEDLVLPSWITRIDDSRGNSGNLGDYIAKHNERSYAADGRSAHSENTFSIADLQVLWIRGVLCGIVDRVSHSAGGRQSIFDKIDFARHFFDKERP